MRLFLLFLLSFSLAAQIPGTFRVTGPVAPPATNSNFGAALPVYNYGGLLTGLSSLSQLQDTNRYPVARRHAGQVARLTTGAEYTLGSDLLSWYNSGSVSNMAQLRSIEPGVGGMVVLESYSGTNDNGGGTYFLTNSIVGTNALGGMIVANGGTNSWVISGDQILAEQFGAKGDGVTDDLSALQAANDFMTNNVSPIKELLLLSKTYLVRSNWNIGDNEFFRPAITIRGFTHGGQTKNEYEMFTQIKLANGANTDVAVVDPYKVVWLIGVGFNGNRDNQTSTNLVGLRLKGSTGLSFQEMEVKDCSFQLVSGYGFYSDRSEFQLLYCTAINNLFGIYSEKGVSSGISDPTFNWVLAAYNTYDGICLTDVGAARISNTDSYGNGRHGFAVTNCFDIRWDRCQANDNYGGGIILAGPANRHTFQASWFAQNNHDRYTGSSKPYGDPASYASGTWSNAEVTGAYSSNNGHVFEACNFSNRENLLTNKPAYSFNDTRTGLPANAGELLFFNNPKWPINNGTNIYYATATVPSGFFTTATMIGGTRGGGTQASTVRQQLNLIGQEGVTASASLNMLDTAGQLGIFHSHYGGASTNHLRWATYALNNTIAAPGALLSGNLAFQQTAFAYNGTTIVNLADVIVSAAEDITSSAAGSRYRLNVVRTNTVASSTVLDLQGHSGSILIDNFSFGKTATVSTNYGISYAADLAGTATNRAAVLLQPTLLGTVASTHGILMRHVPSGYNEFVSGFYNRDPFTNSGGSIGTLVHFWAGGMTNTTATNTAALALGTGPTDGNWFLHNSTAANSKHNGAIQFGETTDQPAPSANAGVLYVRDNGAGKSQLVIRFPSGAIQVIATEP